MNDSSFISSEVSTGGKSHLLYCRSSEKDKISLEEFQMISLVGRGTFGKVFLVYSPVNNKFYALKSMRKDVILDKDSVGSIDLERLIMLQVDHPFIVKMEMVF